MNEGRRGRKARKRGKRGVCTYCRRQHGRQSDGSWWSCNGSSIRVKKEKAK